MVESAKHLYQSNKLQSTTQVIYTQLTCVMSTVLHSNWQLLMCTCVHWQLGYQQQAL